MEQLDASSIVFQHLIDLPNCDCVFCSTVETSTGRTKLFLIFSKRRRIYVRNGMKDTWDELKDAAQFNCIKGLFEKAVSEHKVPCFSA